MTPAKQRPGANALRALKLQRRCQARLRDLPIPDPFDIDRFCAGLAAARGRALHLLSLPPVTGIQAVCGAWVPLPDADVLFVESATSPWHREQIILHECAHMICDHPPSAKAIAGWVHAALPHVDPGAVAGVLLRTDYSAPHEQEAEMTASLIEARVQRRAPAIAPPAPVEYAAVLDQLARALGAPGRS